MKVVVFDLDDTLYNEIDYLKSAFKEISLKLEVEYGLNDVYNIMMEAFYEHKNVFEFINNYYSISFPIDEYLQIYRYHKPKIILNNEVVKTLNDLKMSGVEIGLITDGRTITQKNKIYALGLNQFIKSDCIIISEEFGSEKPNVNNFLYFNDKFEFGNFYYIGDNTKKDFVAPNNLNWITVCLMDSGKNIHPQCFNQNLNYLPKYKIENISYLTEIINK